MKQKSDKLAFVLSDGGSLGSMQVGCLEALLEQGLLPELIVGTSVGAINGAWLAKYPTLEGVARLKKMWLSNEQKAIFSEGRAKALLRLLLGKDFLYTNKVLRELLCRHLRCPAFEDLEIPLYVTATDLDNQKLAVFHSGPLMPGILASTAVPGIFKAVELDGITYVDGAMTSNCSIETAWQHGATTIVAIECPRLSSKRGYGVIGTLSRALSVSLMRLRELERERYRQLCNLVVMEPSTGFPEFYQRADFSKTAEMIATSKQWAEDFLRSPDSVALRPWMARKRSFQAQVNAEKTTTNRPANVANCCTCQWEGYCVCAIGNTS